MCFTLTFSLSFCSLPSDAITHNPLPHSLTSPTSLNQHKFTSLTFSETQPLYQTPVVQFISLSHAWQHLLREEPIPEKTQHQRQAHLSPAPKQSVHQLRTLPRWPRFFSLSLSLSVNHLALFCIPLNFSVCISKFLFRCSVLLLFVFQCFFPISLNIDGFCKIMKFVSDGFCFRVLCGQSKKGKIRHNRGLELKTKGKTRGVWGLLHTIGLEETEKGFWWRWDSTKIWGFRGSFGTQKEEQISSTIAHKTENEKELTSRNRVGCLQAMGLGDMEAEV